MFMRSLAVHSAMVAFALQLTAICRADAAVPQLQILDVRPRNSEPGAARNGVHSYLLTSRDIEIDVQHPGLGDNLAIYLEGQRVKSKFQYVTPQLSRCVIQLPDVVGERRLAACVSNPDGTFQKSGVWIGYQTHSPWYRVPSSRSIRVGSGKLECVQQDRGDELSAGEDSGPPTLNELGLPTDDRIPAAAQHQLFGPMQLAAKPDEATKQDGVKSGVRFGVSAFDQSSPVTINAQVRFPEINQYEIVDPAKFESELSKIKLFESNSAGSRPADNEDVTLIMHGTIEIKGPGGLPITKRLLDSTKITFKWTPVDKDSSSTRMAEIATSARTEIRKQIQANLKKLINEHQLEWKMKLNASLTWKAQTEPLAVENGIEIHLTPYMPGPAPRAMKAAEVGTPATARSRRRVQAHRLVFDQPTHVPFDRLGTAGMMFRDEGLLIAEGMELVLRDDGGYRLKINVSSPIAVRLRLQIQLVTSDEWCHTITVPVQSVPASLGSATMSSEDQGWHSIEVQGRIASLSQWANRVIDMRRSGSAQFGSLPETGQDQTF